MKIKRLRSDLPGSVSCTLKM